jgi:gamma-glutamyltranspeptidase/glutathione hydrolase
MTATLATDIFKGKWRVLAIAAALTLATPAAHAEETRTPATKYIIVASHPLATEAGLKVLRRGGSAVDAAIAAQMVMGLVEPQSSGIGGGAFLMHWNPETGRIESYDGRETAPMAVTPNLFLKEDGTKMPFPEAVLGGRSVGVPGVVDMLWMAHRQHGVRPWAELFEDAIRHAEEGFAVSPRLAAAVAKDPGLPLIPESAAYFLPGGKPVAVGDTLKNPSYAATLRSIAAKGPEGFYRGEVAEAIVSAVQNAPRGPQKLTLSDLARYRALRRRPVCGVYRAYRICGMGPPSSGGIATLQILGVIEQQNVADIAPNSLRAVHLFAEAQRLALADRQLYAADADFVPVPVQGLIDPAYLAKRGALIGFDAAIPVSVLKPGRPPGADAFLQRLRLPAPDHAKASTAHLSVIDDAGRAVAMTTSVEGGFGSHLMAAGFILNNQLTDFGFEPGLDNSRFANAPEAGKRPLSSMSPTLVFDPNGRLAAVVGSPGGWRIIPFVAKTLIGLIDWRLDMAAAISLPHVAARGATLEIENGKGLEALVPALEALGHEVKPLTVESGLNGIQVREDGFVGAADPRREGTVGGE